MKYLHEYRNPTAVKKILELIFKTTKKNWTLMEICGGQTHSIIKFGIDRLLPEKISLIHGPGCPVCVTPMEIIDMALEIAALPDLIFCSFGDMLRVPGSKKDLLKVKSEGADIRILYSPMDALDLAKKNPHKEIVFLAVGFETTAPANAMAVFKASEEGLKNFSLLVSHVLVPPAMEAILSSKLNCVQGFLAAGHVCTIMGLEEYQSLAVKYRVPIVVTGFEPLDILEGILLCVTQLEEGRNVVENQYIRAVPSEGNTIAQTMLQEIFEIVPRRWRGLGEIPQSGLALRQKYAPWDAEKKFKIKPKVIDESPLCLSGLVLQGLKKPTECPAFANPCRPEQPLGATMVSSEGACAAYFRYGRTS